MDKSTMVALALGATLLFFALFSWNPVNLSTPELVLQHDAISSLHGIPILNSPPCCLNDNPRNDRYTPHLRDDLDARTRCIFSRHGFPFASSDGTNTSTWELGQNIDVPNSLFLTQDFGDLVLGTPGWLTTSSQTSRARYPQCLHALSQRPDARDFKHPPSILSASALQTD